MANNLDLVIRKALIDWKMSQADLARLLEISPVYLSDILNGKKGGPKAMEHVERMKELLKINLNENVCS